MSFNSIIAPIDSFFRTFIAVVVLYTLGTNTTMPYTLSFILGLISIFWILIPIMKLTKKDLLGKDM